MLHSLKVQARSDIGTSYSNNPNLLLRDQYAFVAGKASMQLHNLSEKSPLFHAALLFTTLAPLYYASYQYRLTHPYGGAPSLPVDNEISTSAEFIREWLDVQMISPFNPWPLKMYCNRTDWHPNLVFNVINAVGGMGNVKGNILDFLFYAIEAGASIILPGMSTRSETDLAELWAGRANFDNFFDEEWFRTTMAEACPQMKIYEPEASQTLVEALPGIYHPRQRRPDFDEGNTKEGYLEHLDTWLKGNGEFNHEGLNVVNLERTLWEIDTRSLPHGFRRNFGQLLRTSPAKRRPAAVAVQIMAEKYDLRIDPRDAIPKQAFYGAHLRTEEDVQKNGWVDDAYSNFTEQTDCHIAHALKNNLKVIYAASGNQTELERFKEKAAAHRPALNVTTKFDLLPSNEVEAIKELTWDQQALVDFEVLQRCSVFGGFAKSSFSYHVAFARNQRLEDSGLVMDPWSVINEEEGVTFDDGYNRIVGRFAEMEGRVPRGLWP